MNKKVLNGPILSLVSVCAVPRGGEGHKNNNPAVPPSLIPPQIPFGPKMGFVPPQTYYYSTKKPTLVRLG